MVNLNAGGGSSGGGSSEGGPPEAAGVVNELPPTKPLPIWATLLLYVAAALVACTGVVCCLGVIHDDGTWDDEPEFLTGQNKGNADGYSRWNDNYDQENLRNQRTAALRERIADRA